MDELIYTIIAKELNGEANADDKAAIAKWLVEDESNKATYDSLKAAWQKTDIIFNAPEFNTTNAWARVSAKMQQAAPVATKKSISFPAWARYSLAAAAVLLIGVFVAKQYYSTGMVTIAAIDGNMEVTLPDNSHITVRKGSVLKYPKKFADNKRDVTLEGEAFFEVARNEKSPFVINAQSAEVKVLGTSFNVKCDIHKASVVVRTGKVQMKAVKSKAAIILTPGEKGMLQNDELTEELVSVSNYLSWKDGLISFANTPLSVVLAELSDVTDTPAMFDPSYPEAARSQLVTISFNKQSLSEMMTDLCLITQSTWQKKDSTIIISSK